MKKDEGRCIAEHVDAAWAETTKMRGPRRERIRRHLRYVLEHTNGELVAPKKKARS